MARLWICLFPFQSGSVEAPDRLESSHQVILHCRQHARLPYPGRHSHDGISLSLEGQQLVSTGDTAKTS